MFIELKQAGALTTVQDQGRYGFQGQGIPVSGVLDPLALKTVNILLGNEENHPVLECIGIGPVLEFSDSVYFAVSGGAFPAFLNEEEIHLNTVYQAKKGDRLKVTYSAVHRSCCIGFAADFDLIPVYGSFSTDVRSGIGGVEGRKLKSGDRIELKNVRTRMPGLKKRTCAPYPAKEEIIALRILEGADAGAFTDEGRNTFYSSTYTVSLQSDRMGFRLEGPSLETVDGNDILSAGTVRGAVQITPQQPILMMADHATTGGYTVIGTVITADLAKASQLIPGDRIRFCRATMEEAQQALREQTETLAELKKRLEPSGILKLFAR